MRQRKKVRRGHQNNQRQHRAHHDAPELDEPEEGIIWEHRVDEEADKGHHHRHRENSARTIQMKPSMLIPHSSRGRNPLMESSRKPKLRQSPPKKSAATSSRRAR